MGNETKWTKWTKWTKGPWVRGKDGSIKDVNGEIVGATGLALVTGYRDPSDPAFANAHLIAAAPELYEALDMLMEPTGPGDAAQLIAEERENIMALLAKARGEQS